MTQPLAQSRPAAAGPLARPMAALATFDGRALLGLGGLSAVLYLVGLTVSGYANTYYAMAAQAASQSWTAWFFGALDASGFISLDKPPLATMLMGLSVRILGLSPFSVLLPQALLGIGTVLVLYVAVRRSFGRRAAVLAGVVMALMPVSVLIFRYDNPDALLTFLLVAAAWALGRGLDDGRIRWAVLAAALVGAGFLTKFLQAWIVLPVFALTWAIAAPGSARRRLAGLVAAGVTAIVASGWWVAIVDLIPSGSRPYVGGSQTDSALELVLGYDGLGRIFGERRGVGGLPGSGLGSALDGLVGGGQAGPGGPSFGGTPGLLRMINEQFGGEVGWLVPAAVLAVLILGVAVIGARRTDRRVGGALLWGGWLLIHLAVFSLMSGIIHPYYAVVLVPAIAAVTAAAAVWLWDHRAASPFAGPYLGVGIALSGLVAWLVTGRVGGAWTGLGIGAFALSVAAALVLAIPRELLDARVARAAAALALVAALAGPTGFSVATMAAAHSGGDPAAGPVTPGAFGGPGGGVVGDAGLGMGGDTALTSFLLDHRGSARWIAAVNGSGSAAGLQLATGAPVMTMGGFSGSDPAPTTSALQAYVHAGELRYVIAGGGFGGAPGGGGGFGGFGPGGGSGGDRAAWLQSACVVVPIAGSTSGATVYDCAPAAG